jgi:glycine/D-amino acid oxidase-like deaminating enzyme
MATVDAIVIGAGYIGSAISYYLTKAGLKTALLDQGGLAAGASRANYGNIQIQDAELEHSLPMVLAGRATFDTLEEELVHDIGLRAIGSLLIAESENQAAALQVRAARLREFSVDSEWLSPEDLRRLEPHLDVDQTFGALYNAHEGQVNPFKLIWAFVHRARGQGLRLQLHCPVEDFIVGNGSIRGVVTPQGPLESKVTVLATGAWSAVLGEKLGLHIPVMHVHGQACVTGYVGNLLNNHMASAAFFESIHADHKPTEDAGPKATLAIAPTAEGNLLLGEASAVARSFSSRTHPAALKAISQVARRFIPALKSAQILRSWAAPVAFTADDRPFIGAVAGLEGLLLAVAFKSTVIITPLIGQTIAQLASTGQSDLDISPFLLSRVNSAL